MLESLLPALLASASVLATGLYLTRLAKKQQEKRSVRQRVPVRVRKEEEK